MNKKSLYLIISGLLIIFLVWLVSANTFSNRQQDQDSTETVKVAATIFPVYDIVRNVAGDMADVELILAQGASPHTFDPSPSTLTKLQGSRLIFAIGQGVDSWTLNIADNVPGSRIVELDQNIKLRASSDTHEEDKNEDGEHQDEEHAYEEAGDHDAHGDFDPHYWLNPKNAIIIANSIVSELSNIDADNAAIYKANANAFIAKLNESDISWQQKFKDIPTRDIVTFHDSFFYFAAHFGLNVVATFEPFPGKEPAPSYLKELQEELAEYKIHTLFTEPQLSSGSLEQFAKDNNISIGVLDPLGGIDNRKSYIDLIDYNVQTVIQASK